MIFYVKSCNSFVPIYACIVIFYPQYTESSSALNEVRWKYADWMVWITHAFHLLQQSEDAVDAENLNLAWIS